MASCSAATLGYPRDSAAPLIPSYLTASALALLPGQFGWPGVPARWTSSAKSAVGTALRAESRVWFTISHGILNEIYAPRLDGACVRDFGFIVTAKNYFSVNITVLKTADEIQKTVLDLMA